MSDLHCLHADHEGMREHAGHEQGGRGPADHGVAPGEMPGIRDAGAGIKNERHNIHGYQCDVGAKYPSLVRAVRLGRFTRTMTRRHDPSRFGLRDVYPTVYWLDSSSEICPYTPAR